MDGLFLSYLYFKRKVYNMGVLPVATYCLETITLTKSAHQLNVSQIGMLNISLRDKMQIQDIKAKTQVI